MEDRFIGLETRIAFLEHELEEQSSVVYKQHLQLQKMEQAILALNDKLKAINTSHVKDINDETPPPHY